MDDVPPPFDPAAEPTQPRGRVGIAWAVVVFVIAALIGVRALEPEPEADESEKLANFMLEVQGRVLVGSNEVLAELQPGDDKARLDNARQIEANVNGSIAQRQRWVVILGEMAGPDFGRRQLVDIETLAGEHEVAIEGEQARVQEALHVLYTERDTPEDESDAEDDGPKDELPASVTFLSEEQRATLTNGLGWFGELALLPADGGDEAGRNALLGPAKRSFYLVFVFLGGGCLALLAGCVGLLLLLALTATRKLPYLFGPETGPHGIYAETFAVWFVLFVGLQLPLAVLPAGLLLPGTVAVFFLSLSALAWPVRRGIPWATVRRDLGLHGGKYGIIEPAFGLVAYLSTLPLLLAGALVSVLLMGMVGMFQTPPGPLDPVVQAGHPVVLLLADGDVLTRVSAVIALCVAAPIVEEIAFRGLLYRHLRGGSVGMGRALSTLASALFNGFLFASVHPQGLVGLPVLTVIGFSLCIARENRDTLLPCITMHAINNGVVCVMLFGMLP